MKDIVETMEKTSGTVFLYCSVRNETSIALFKRAAGSTGRRFFSREDCQALDPTALAGAAGKKAVFAAPAMMDFLDRYLEACPAGQRHVLIHVHEAHEAIRSMSYVFHDFWEERHVNIEEQISGGGKEHDSKL